MRAARCRLVSFLCDLAHWALEVQHARSFADDTVEHPSLQVRSRHDMRDTRHAGPHWCRPVLREHARVAQL